MADPLSIAAGVAGFTSLSLQLLGGCIKGFILLSTARNLDKDSSTIVCILHIQEIQLTEWAQRAGILDSGVLDPRLNAAAVEMILRQLQDLLSDATALKKRYGLVLVDSHGPSPQLPQLLDAAPTVSTGISHETRQWILSKAGTLSEPGIFKKLWWAAVDKDKITQLAADIQSLVRGLWELLDHWQQKELLGSTRSIGASLVALNDKFNELSFLADALRALGVYDKMPSMDLESIAISAEMKALKIGLCREGIESPSAPKRQTLLRKLAPLNPSKVKNFMPIDKDKQMGLGEYDGEVVFMEKKAIDRIGRSKVLPRAENLAALLNLPKNESFSSFICRGITQDDDVVSFIFNHPNPAQPQTPRPLLSLFSNKESGIPTPGLTTRVRLALHVARIVQNFHRAGWLHKNIRSENILFLEHGSDASTVLRQPFLVGFSFARANSATEISEQPSANANHDLYRHPAALGEPTEAFSATMDAYSLGAVLLEIAEWRPLRYIVRSFLTVGAGPIPLDRLAKVQSFLLDGKGDGGTSRLKEKMGDLYTQACLVCLGAQVDRIWLRYSESHSVGNPLNLVDISVQLLEGCNV